jgi:hypothetical protein
MEHEQVEQAVARKSALIYLPIAFGAALLFWLPAWGVTIPWWLGLAGRFGSGCSV